jgi:hypothetical protein
MKSLAYILSLSVPITFAFAGAPQKRATSKSDSKDIFAAQLGKEVTLVGEAQSLKEGQRLVGKDFVIWIDGLKHWPDEVVGKQVSVTGVVIERYDLPVYIRRPGEPALPLREVPAGTDLHKASHRYLLKAAKWKLYERNIHALQRTAPCIMAPASASAFSPAMQGSRSLSLGSMGTGN